MLTSTTANAKPAAFHFTLNQNSANNEFDQDDGREIWRSCRYPFIILIVI
jgi:hypothetical protein